MIQRQHGAQQWWLWITHKPSQGALPFLLNSEMASASVVSSVVSALLSDSKSCSEWGPGQLRCYCICRECRVEGNKARASQRPGSLCPVCLLNLQTPPWSPPICKGRAAPLLTLCVYGSETSLDAYNS